jgi:hypothetical protein
VVLVIGVRVDEARRGTATFRLERRDHELILDALVDLVEHEQLARRAHGAVDRD